MNFQKCAAAASAAAALAAFTALPAFAGPGHDHDDDTPATVGRALPRFSAVSEAFELVGVLRDKQLTLYLDRFADNSPVRGAQLELEIGGATFKAEPQGDDEYVLVLPEAPKPGVLPVTATITVTASKETDLLAGELDIQEAAHAHDGEHTHSRKEIVGWAVAGLAALGLLTWAGRRVMHARGVRTGAAA